MISDSHRFVFVHIPRTGGTSVETALAALSRDPVRFVARGNTAFPHKHDSAAELAARLGADWGRYMRFSIVRDPWARMLSDYKFFRETGPLLYDGFSPRERALTEAAGGLDLEGWLFTFADELRMAQTDYLTDDRGELLVEHVLRTERLAEDFAAICARLGIRVALPHLNRTEPAGPRSSFTPAAAALVAERCAEDLRRFGYRFGDDAVLPIHPRSEHDTKHE
jgi:hypothetical protein